MKLNFNSLVRVLNFKLKQWICSKVEVHNCNAELIATQNDGIKIFESNE